MAFIAIAPIFPAPIANAIARLAVCVALVLMYHMSAGYVCIHIDALPCVCCNGLAASPAMCP